MYKIQEVQKVLKGNWLIANEEARIDTILQDSRKLENAEHLVFCY
jgi:hypothetical protein